jgi:CRISPR/Cas system Type II protein with McrA/HNH and RuvC-like nuclease domain
MFGAKRIRRKMWLSDPRCEYCLRKLRYDESTLDHVVPLSRGGKDSYFNVVLCCKKCNAEKDDLTYDEFAVCTDFKASCRERVIKQKEKKRIKNERLKNRKAGTRYPNYLRQGCRFASGSD